MSHQPPVNMQDDDILELPFITNYAKFALRMNFRAIVALLKEARSVSDPVERKSICLSGLQLLHSSCEDFAILLHAFKERITGKHIHLSIGVEDQPREGSTQMPQIFKYYKSARQMLDNFGFTSLTDEKLSQFYGITQEESERHFRVVAESIKILGEYQKISNDYKNKLKHGKPVVEDATGGPSPDHILFLRWREQDGKLLLEKRWVPVPLEQLEVATIQVAKIYTASLDLVGLFILHYYPTEAAKVLPKTLGECSRECSEKIRALGLHSQGLTHA